MNEATDPIEERIVGAMHRELSRFGTEIADRFAELQHHAAAETAARASLESQVAELTARSADADDAPANAPVDLGAFDARMQALEQHSESARQHVSSMVERVDAAANGLTERVARFDEDRVAMDARLDRLDRRRNEAIERLDSVEGRLGGIDEIVQGATVGIGDRVNELAAAHEATSAELTTIRAQMAETDAEAIEELKEKVSSALGQAELVRIEMDRFQESVTHDLDASVSRLTAIETAVQDQRMDVEAAVQLERLEEVERMVLMLDPAQGGRRAYDPAQGGRRERDSSPEPANRESESEDSGFAAVIAAAEARAAGQPSDDSPTDEPPTDLSPMSELHASEALVDMSPVDLSNDDPSFDAMADAVEEEAAPSLPTMSSTVGS